MVPWPDFLCLEAPSGPRLTPPSLLRPGLGRGGHLPGNGTRCSPGHRASSAPGSAVRTAGTASGDRLCGTGLRESSLSRYEMAAQKDGAVLRLSPSEQEDEEDEEAEAARRAQRFALDRRVRFLGGRLQQALGFPEEAWGEYLESEDHRQVLGDFLESSGPANLVFSVAPGLLSASPEVRRNLRGCGLWDLKSTSWSPCPLVHQLYRKHCTLVFCKGCLPKEIFV